MLSHALEQHRGLTWFLSTFQRYVSCSAPILKDTCNVKLNHLTVTSPWILLCLKNFCPNLNLEDSKQRNDTLTMSHPRSCGWEHPEPIHQWSGMRPRTEGVLPIVIGILTADSRDRINSKVKEVYLPNLCGSVSWIVNVHRPWAGGSLFGRIPSRRKQAGARLQTCFWSSLISHLSIFLKRNPQKGISPCIPFWYDPWWLLLQVELLMRSKVIGPSPRKSPIMRQLPKGSTHKFFLQGKKCQRK